MERQVEVRGAAHLHVVDGVGLVDPAAQVFEAMLDGWRSQQLSRNLAFPSIDSGARVVRRFRADSGRFPGEWAPADLESWCAHLRSSGARARSTVRSYQLAVRSFLAYVVDPVYGWDRECLARFGTHPVQICGPATMAVHAAAYEGRPSRRALSRAELQDLFDAADEVAVGVRARGRKGWAAAFRDATMLKAAYAWGLRRREVLMLEEADFGPNPKAPEFGAFGVCYVRWGKASHGSGPRRRSVLTVMGWSVEVMAEWVHDVWPHLRGDGHGGLWPSERGPTVSEDRLGAAFARAAAEAGLPTGLSPHCLRHSYVTHLIEDGFDALFVQQQVGHEHASTTSIYTSVSSDYRTKMVRDAIDRAVAQAKEAGTQW